MPISPHSVAANDSSESPRGSFRAPAQSIFRLKGSSARETLRADGLLQRWYSANSRTAEIEEGFVSEEEESEDDDIKFASPASTLNPKSRLVGESQRCDGRFEMLVSRRGQRGDSEKRQIDDDDGAIFSSSEEDSDDDRAGGLNCVAGPAGTSLARSSGRSIGQSRRVDSLLESMYPSRKSSAQQVEDSGDVEMVCSSEEEDYEKNGPSQPWEEDDVATRAAPATATTPPEPLANGRAGSARALDVAPPSGDWEAAYSGVGGALGAALVPQTPLGSHMEGGSMQQGGGTGGAGVAGGAGGWETEQRGKTRVLCIDGGGMRGILPATVLTRLERMLQEKSGNPHARVADYFDLVAGTSVGSMVAVMLFTPDKSGRPLFTAAQAQQFVAEKGSTIFHRSPLSRFTTKNPLLSLVRQKFSHRNLEGVLKEHLVRDGRPLSLKDMLKPVLIPCFDIKSGSPFLFSRFDALAPGDAARDFALWEVLLAATAFPGYFPPHVLESLNGGVQIAGIDGGIVLNNPTAAAITHVLRNGREFPGARSADDLLVLSLGTGAFADMLPPERVRRWGLAQWALPLIRIVFDGIGEAVDHTVAMAFSEGARDQYLRLQKTGLRKSALMEMDDPSVKNVQRLQHLASEILSSKAVRRHPSGLKTELQDTTCETRLAWFADQLIKEDQERANRSVQVVRIKPDMVRRS